MTALTPAEALILLDPVEAPGIDAVKVTVLSLLAQGYLRGGTKAASSMLGRGRQVPTVSPGRPYPAPVPAHVEELLDVVRTARDPAMPKVAESFVKTFGQKCTLFRTAYVQPLLVSKGLLERREQTEKKRVLGLFSRTVTRVWHVRTAAGEAECARIRRSIADARGIPQFLSSDPARAAAMAAALGGLIFLVAELAPYYQQLSMEMARANAGTMNQNSSDSSGGSDSGSGSPTLEPPDFTMAWTVDQTFTSLSDSLDAAMDAADSSGGDSGGDGGGGDGGGGGE